MQAEKKGLPKGWVTTSIGDLVEILDSKRIPLNSNERAARKGPYPYYGANGQVDSIDSFIFDGDFALLAEDGGHFNDPYRPIAYQAKGKFWANNHVHVLRTLWHMPTKFIIYSLNHADLMPFVTGTTRLKLNQAAMKRIPVHLPPLKEQKLIVTKLEELQARSRRAREALETIPDLLEQLRQSILAAAFRGDLTRKWREKHRGEIEPATELLKRIRAERRKRWEESELEKLKAKGLTGKKLDEAFNKRRKQYKEPAPVDTTNLPELPEQWCWASIEELSDNLQYGSSAKSSKSGKVPVIRMGNLQNGDIDWSDLVFSSNEVEIKKFKLTPNTVLFNRTNSPELVGKTAVYRGEREAIFAGYLIAIQNVPQILSTYLNLMLNSPFLRHHCLTVKSDAVSQSNINATKLAEFPIPLCSQIEQKKMVSLIEPNLDEIRKKMDRQKESLGSLYEFEQSILSKAFRGQLVPQDPRDEPASVLLKRIQQEKARLAVEQKAKPKRRGKKMKRRKSEKQDIITILREASHAMTPEEVFAAGRFDEDSVDAFYEQLRDAVVKKQAREIRKGDTVQLEAVS